jgi:hypothetical protein
MVYLSTQHICEVFIFWNKYLYILLYLPYILDFYILLSFWLNYSSVECVCVYIYIYIYVNIEITIFHVCNSF